MSFLGVCRSDFTGQIVERSLLAMVSVNFCIILVLGHITVLCYAGSMKELITTKIKFVL